MADAHDELRRRMSPVIALTIDGPSDEALEREEFERAAAETIALWWKALSRAAVPDEGIDGVVLELCDEGLKDAAEPELYCTMKRVLSELCQHNITVHPEDAKYCCYHILSAPNTQLRLCGQAFGAMCFAPSLSQTDPR